MSAPDFEPPQAAISRIIKSVLPANVQVTKEARAAFTRAASIFIFYLTHCANDFSREGKRQTIYLQDVKNALRELDFEDFEGPLEEFLEVYRKAQQASADKNSSAKSATAAASGGALAEGEAEDADMNLEADEEADDQMEENEEEEPEPEPDEE